jgi:hypothetical protein
MIVFFATLLRFFFHAFRSQRIILFQNALLKKGNGSIDAFYRSIATRACLIHVNALMFNRFRCRLNRRRWRALIIRTEQEAI